MNSLNTVTADASAELLDRHVIDDKGDEIGTIDAFWTDEISGKIEFVGVKTGWIFGKTHIVPAEGVEIADNGNIRVPYDAEYVRNAPSYPADQNLTDVQEEEIYRHYNISAQGHAVHAGTTAGTAGGMLSGTAEGIAAGAAGAVGGAVGAVTGAGARHRDDDLHRGSPVTGTDVGRTGVDITDESGTGVGRTGVGLKGEDVSGSSVSGTDVGTSGVLPVNEGLASGQTSETLRETTGTRTGVGREGVVEVPLAEETLNVGKRTVEEGRVRLRKIVRTEQANVPVELRREDVVIERVTPESVTAGTETSFREEQIEVPLTREEAVVQKETHVTGAVRVRKTEDAETRTVGDTVRREDVVVDDSRSGREHDTTTTGHEKIEGDITDRDVKDRDTKI